MRRRPRISMADGIAMDLISKIAARAVDLYAQNDIRVDRKDILMDITTCHFGAQRLRLDDLLMADDENFAHDIGGINRHLDRESGKLTNCFSPRYSARAK